MQGTTYSKEGNWALKPFGTRSTESSPSLVLEVGMSESMQQLRADARFWYANSGTSHSTKLMSVPLTPRRRVDIEVWTETPSPRRAEPAH